MPLEHNAESSPLRTTGMFLLNSALAVVGTATLELELWYIVPTHPASSVVCREWTLGVVCAAVIGFFAYKQWKNKTAMWVWVLPTFWFGFGILVASHATDFSGQLDGSACKTGHYSKGCTYFFLFTVPSIRSLAFSLAALFSSRIFKAAQNRSDHVGGTASGFEE